MLSTVRLCYHSNHLNFMLQATPQGQTTSFQYNKAASPRWLLNLETSHIDRRRELVQEAEPCMLHSFPKIDRTLVKLRLMHSISRMLHRVTRRGGHYLQMEERTLVRFDWGAHVLVVRSWGPGWIQHSMQCFFAYGFKCDAHRPCTTCRQNQKRKFDFPCK